MANPVLGSNMVLYYHDVATNTDIPFACSTSCAFDVQVDQKEVTSQTSAWYRQFKNDTAAWQISCDGLIILDNYSYLFMLQMQQNRTTIGIKFVIDNGTIGGLVIINGNVNLASLTLNGPYDGLGTYSAKLQGTGAYTTTGTQITPGGVVIYGTTVYVLQWTASGDETSHVFTAGIGYNMIYGSRGGTSFAPLVYTGSAPSPNGCKWESVTGTLSVPSDVPFVNGENVIILVE
jgi:predicted secreted protein